jgi:hypothetical protein
MDAVNFRNAAARVALGALALTAVVSMEVGRRTWTGSHADPAADDRLSGRSPAQPGHAEHADEVLDTGQKIQYDPRPASRFSGRTRCGRAKGDLVSQVVIYDGKTLAVYNRSNNYYAVAAAPDNIDDALHFARDALDIVPPSGDLIYSNAFDLLTAQVTSGMVVGKSMIGGVKCDHLAFGGPVVDWQIWIADGDKPLPLKYVITTKDDPAQPQYMVLMSNWKVAPKLNDAMFKFTPPQGAKKTDFIRLDADK